MIFNPNDPRNNKRTLFANGYQNLAVTGGWIKDALRNDGQADGVVEIGDTIYLSAYRSVVASGNSTVYYYHDAAARTVDPINVDEINFIHLKVDSRIGETISGWVGLQSSVDNMTRNDYKNASNQVKDGYTVFDETYLANSNIISVDVSMLSGDFYPVIFLIGVDAEFAADGNTRMYDSLHISKVWHE